MRGVEFNSGKGNILGVVVCVRFAWGSTVAEVAVGFTSGLASARDNGVLPLGARRASSSKVTYLPPALKILARAPSSSVTVETTTAVLDCCNRKRNNVRWEGGRGG